MTGFSTFTGFSGNTGLWNGNSGLWGGSTGFAALEAYLYLNFLSGTLDSRITFTRGSNATLVNSTGKIVYAPANLVLQSQTIATAPWSGDTSGGTVPIATNNAGIAPDGTNTATRLQLNRGAGSFSRWNQNVVSAAVTYVYSIYMKTFSGGTSNVGLRLDATGINCVVTETWQRFSITLAVSAGTTLCQILSFTSIPGTDVSADILVWGAQLEPVTYQTTPSTYVATTSAAYYGPRFDYDPVTLAAKGLLIEEQRVNRTLQSEDFTVSPWAAAVSGTSTRVNTNTSLGFMRGTITATSALGGIRQAYSGLTSAQVYALSFYVQSSSTSLIVTLENGTASFGSPHTVTLNPSNGTAGTPTGYTSVTSTPFGSGYVYTLITAAAGGTLLANVEWRFTNNGDSMLYGRPQFEAGAFATSYIPTVASTVTRSADVASMTGTNFSSWYNQTQGTFVADFDKYTAASRGVVVVAGDTSLPASGSDISIDGQNNGFVRAFIENVGSLEMLNATLATYTANTPIKGAVAYATNDAIGAAAGALGTVDTSVVVPTLNALQIGANRNNVLAASVFLNGHIRTIAYYNTRLSNAQLQALTA